MRVVIQCAGGKVETAGTLRTASGTPLAFVAHPEQAPDDGHLYAHPDDRSDTGETWRERVQRRNDEPVDAEAELLRAADLYDNLIYSRLAEGVGVERLYILSAGWGLVRGDFRLPDYDVTFQQQAPGYKRRRRSDAFDDFHMLTSGREPVLFFGGSAYLDFFARLIRDVDSPLVVFHASEAAPDVPGARTIQYRTRRRTNWHYECAQAFLAGTLDQEIGRCLERSDR